MKIHCKAFVISILTTSGLLIVDVMAVRMINSDMKYIKMLLFAFSNIYCICTNFPVM